MHIIWLEGNLLYIFHKTMKFERAPQGFEFLNDTNFQHFNNIYFDRLHMISRRQE